MRLDSYLFEKGIYPSRTKASEAILRGEVLYNGKIVKASLEVSNESLISYVNDTETFVSNGGYKLEKALNDFNFDVSGLVFADIGASNGGFTDCLLKRNAKKVYAIDVGESQLHTSLLNDSRVAVIDNFNARNLTINELNGYVDGITCDVSFISLTYLLNAVYSVLKENGVAFLLIKPQFECGKEFLGKSGIVKNVKVRKQACIKIYDFAVSLGFKVVGFTTAPIKEKKNVEYVIMLKKGGTYNEVTAKNIEDTVYLEK